MGLNNLTGTIVINMSDLVLSLSPLLFNLQDCLDYFRGSSVHFIMVIILNPAECIYFVRIVFFLQVYLLFFVFF